MVTEDVETGMWKRENVETSRDGKEETIAIARIVRGYSEVVSGSSQGRLRGRLNGRLVRGIS